MNERSSPSIQGGVQNFTTPWPAQIRHGWLGRDLSRQQIDHALTAHDVAALRAVVKAARADGRAMTDLRQSDFHEPALAERLSHIAQDLRWGLGLIVITGLRLEDFEPAEAPWLYWAIGLHFGEPVSQNIHGDLMGEVRVRDDQILGRAYNRGGPLPFHSDRIDILSLFSIREAASGGANTFVSSLAVHDIVAEERPDLLKLFRGGFYQHLGNEHDPSADPITSHRIPIFADYEGLRSCLFSGNASLTMQRQKLGDRFTPQDDEALSFLRSILDRPEMAFRVLLKPGEIVFINNYEVLHSRDDFEDSIDPNERRFLLRLWLQGQPWRPKVADMVVICNASGRQGIDPRPLKT